jgi:hypothetical protein
MSNFSAQAQPDFLGGEYDRILSRWRQVTDFVTDDSQNSWRSSGKRPNGFLKRASISGSTK